MEYEVRITLQAQAHLHEIRDYIAQKLLAPEAAKNTVQRLGTVMASLSQMPKRVPLVEEEPWRSEGVRVRAVRNFLIYFWVNEAEKTVQIIAVIYAKRDQANAGDDEDTDVFERFLYLSHPPSPPLALRFACARVSCASCCAALAHSGFALLIRLPPSQWMLSGRDTSF